MRAMEAGARVNGSLQRNTLRACSGIALQDVRTKNFSLLFQKGFFFNDRNIWVRKCSRLK